MLRRMLCGASLIAGSFWGLYLVYGWWAFSSLIALGAMASITRQGMIESLVSQTVLAVVLLGVGAALREPKVIYRKVKAGARRVSPAGPRAGAWSRDSLQGIEDYDPLVDGAAAGDAVRMALIRKYRIRRDDSLGLIICQGQAFRSLDEALEHARLAEIEAKRQLRGQHHDTGSGETGHATHPSEAAEVAAGTIRDLMRAGPTAASPLAEGANQAAPAGAPGRAGQRTMVPAT